MYVPGMGPKGIGPPLPVGSTHPPPASGWDWREFSGALTSFRYKFTSGGPSECADLRWTGTVG